MTMMTVCTFFSMFTLVHQPGAKQSSSSTPPSSRAQGEMQTNKQEKKTSLAAPFHVIVTAFWCHHQLWHFIHTEHLWAHHICFSTQRIFKCFPGNCFNTICLLGNLVPTNAMPLSPALFLGLPILAHKCHMAGFFCIQLHRSWTRSYALNWRDELLTHLHTLTNSSSGEVPEEAGSKANVTSHWRLRHLALKLGRAYITVSIQLIFSRNGNGLTLLRTKLHVIFILLPVLKEIFHSFLYFVAWIVIRPINESSQNFPSRYRQQSVQREPMRLSFSSQGCICCCRAAEDRVPKPHRCRSSHWCFTTWTSAPCGIFRDSIYSI